MRTVVSVLVSVIVLAGCAGTPAASSGPSATGAGPSIVAPTLIPTEAGAPNLPGGGVIPAGTYSLDHKHGITIDAPAGWSTCCGSVIRKNDFTGLLFEDVTDVVVYADACAWSTAGESKPRGAKAIAAALSAQRLREGSQPRAVTVDGLPGMHVRLTVPADQPVIDAGEDHSFTGCDSGEFRSFETAQGGRRFHQGASQIDDYYIVDVARGTVVFDIMSSPNVAASDMAELEAMLASVQIK